VLADNGYFSAENVTACRSAKIEPLIAAGRQPHHPSLRDRFAVPPPPPENPTPLAAMRHRLATPRQQEALRAAQTDPEPVFGIIKSVLGFRQFLLRDLYKVQGEWSLATMAWSIKRMFGDLPLRLGLGRRAEVVKPAPAQAGGRCGWVRAIATRGSMPQASSSATAGPLA
jgi:hypothetical protein